MSDLSNASEVNGNFSFILDAIFGFSFKGNVRAPFDSILDMLSKVKIPLCSVDVPSGECYMFLCALYVCFDIICQNKNIYQKKAELAYIGWKESRTNQFKSWKSRGSNWGPCGWKTENLLYQLR